MKSKRWTSDEIEILEQGYKNDLPIREISSVLPGRTEASIIHKAKRMGFSDTYIKKNNINYKALYQNYNWCYERYITKGMSHQEMADELGVSLRVIQKWCVEIHGLHSDSFCKLKKLSDKQKEMIIAGTLGDGHIDKRDNYPIYIESHSETETEYIFWKYSVLKDLCGHAPIFYPSKHYNFGKEKEYLCKSFQRLTTRKIDELNEIKGMSKIEKMNTITAFGFALHLLDDGHRNNAWVICLADWTQEEIDYYISMTFEKFHLTCKQEKDDRYVRFDSESSRKIDEIILNNIPNNLDVIVKKITNNKRIGNFVQYRYIITKQNKQPLGVFCKRNHLNYYKCRMIMNDLLNVTELEEEMLVGIYSEVISNEI